MISILPESNYAAVMTETVEPYLDSRRQEMDMPLSTGGTLHAEVYEIRMLPAPSSSCTATRNPPRNSAK